MAVALIPSCGFDRSNFRKGYLKGWVIYTFIKSNLGDFRNLIKKKDLGNTTTQKQCRFAKFPLAFTVLLISEKKIDLVTGNKLKN